MSTLTVPYRTIGHEGKSLIVDSARRRIHRSIGALARTIVGALYMVIVVIAFLLAGTVVVISLVNSSVLEVKSIQITGLQRVQRQELQATMDLWPGDSILAINMREIGRQALTHPWIREADIQRTLPHTITMRVAEREPVALVQLDHLYYVDEQGFIFARATPQVGLDFPVITGLDLNDALEANSKARQMLEKAMGVIEFLRRNKNMLPSLVSEVHLDPVLGLTFMLEGRGVAIFLGSDEVLEKISRLHMVLQTMEQQGKRDAISRIDLNYKDRVVVSFRL